MSSSIKKIITSFDFEMEEGDSLSWCLKGLRRELKLGRKERVCGGGCRLKALKYFLSRKRDLLTDISGIVSQ